MGIFMGAVDLPDDVIAAAPLLGESVQGWQPVLYFPGNSIPSVDIRYF